MPWPKSSISLSIASARPSTLATPSPISRMTPTVCLAAAALAPAICASISWTRSAMVVPHSSGAHRAVPRARPAGRARCRRRRRCRPDAHAADQRRDSRANDVSSAGAVAARQVRLDARRAGRRSAASALSTTAVCRSRSRRTSRWKSASTASEPRRPDRRRARCATWRTRSSSSVPFDEAQPEELSRASRRTLRFAFIVPTLPAAAAVSSASRR